MDDDGFVDGGLGYAMHKLLYKQIMMMMVRPKRSTIVVVAHFDHDPAVIERDIVGHQNEETDYCRGRHM